MPLSVAMLDRISPEPNSGCWLWTGRGHSNGYGRIGEAFAHRAVFEAVKGAIPAGLHIDHLCRNRSCVNPDHLEAVTCKVNILRGVGPSAMQAKQAACLNGHSLSGDNLIPNARGTRQCRQCHYDRRHTAVRPRVAA